MKNKWFAALAMLGFLLLSASSAMAAQESGVGQYMDYALGAAALGMGLATFGGAIAQGRTAASALEGIARNPQAADRMFVPMVLGLVLIESLVIYSLVVEILVWTKWSP